MNNTQIKKNAKYAFDYETDMNGNILDVSCVKLDARSKCPGNVQEYTVSTSIYPISVPVKCESCGNVEERQFEVIIERNRGMVNYYISDPQSLDRRYCFGMEADKALSFEEVAHEMVLDFIPVLLKEEAVMDAYHESLPDDDDDYDCSDETHESEQFAKSKVREVFERTLNNCKFYEMEGKRISLLNEIGTLRGLMYAMEYVDRCPMNDEVMHFINLQESLKALERR